MSIGDFQRERALSQECAMTCEQIMGEKVGLVEGVRRLVLLSYQLGAADDTLYLQLRGIDSESLQFPLGEARESWDQDALAVLDEERQSFESLHRDLVYEICRRIAERVRTVYYYRYDG